MTSSFLRFKTLAMSVLALSIAALAALGSAQTDYPVLAITVTESGLEAPASVPAGLYRVVAEGRGEMSTDIQLIRLEEGTTPEQMVAAYDKMVNARGPEAGAAQVEAVGLVEAVVGGVGFPPAVVRLEPGTYFAVIWGPQEGGPSYAAQGFHTTFTVTESDASMAAPEVDLVVDMMDFAFTIPDELPAGEQTWEVTNVGDQVHHLILFKVREGKTVADVMGFLQSEGSPAGPPPFEEAGAVQVLTPGESTYVTFDLAPGAYVALCFLPDYETGVPHVAKGMVDTFTVEKEQ